MAVDVARVRGLVPALGDGWVHFDAPTGTQVPEQVASAVSAAMRAPVGPPGGTSPFTRRAGAVAEDARRALADLVGGDPRGVVLGSSVPSLLERLAEVLADDWRMGDEVVVTRLDDPANVTPWRCAAHRVGAQALTAEIDVETCELPAWQFERLVGPRTRMVAVTAACPSVGTRTEVAAIARTVHALAPPDHGLEPLVVVDGRGAAPYLPLDLDSLGADVLAVCVAGWGGPAVAGLVFRDPELLGRLPGARGSGGRGAGRLERPEEAPTALLAGLGASVDYLADLDEDAAGSRRDRVLASMTSLRAHHTRLAEEMLARLDAVAGVTVLGAPVRRIPTFAITVSGRSAEETAAHLARRGVCVLVDPGDGGALGAIGGAEVGGVVRLGLGPYTSRADVDTLVDALAGC